MMEKQVSIGEAFGPNRDSTPTFVNILAEDYASYGVKEDSLEDLHEMKKKSGQRSSGGRTDSTLKANVIAKVQCIASIQLDNLMSNVMNKVDENDSDEEEIAQSNLLRFGPLKGNYLLDFAAD